MKTLFYNGNIVTMNNHIRCDAVLINDDKIISLGKYDELKQLIDSNTKLVDLNHNSMYPGFIDAHSHITGVAFSLAFPDLSKCNSIDEVISTMKNNLNEYLNIKDKKPMQFFVGENYNNNNFINQTQPTRKDLDKIAEDIPILIVNISGHVAVANTLALKRLNILDDIKDPIGGKYCRYDDKTLNGVLEERAWLDNVSKIDLTSSLQQQIELLKKAQNYYLSYGLTTAHDGRISPLELNLLREAINQKILKIDVNGYVDVMHYSTLFEDNKDLHNYVQHVKLAGLKIFIDGSPQERTAWMSKPYLLPKGTINVGQNHWTSQQIQPVMNDALNKCYTVIAHINGDAACSQFIDCTKEAIKTINKPINKWTGIHCQFMTKEQINDLALNKINLNLSFFVSHVYYWGDTHIANVGFEKAKNISPSQSALKNKLNFTFHEDSPVVAPDQILAIHCAVNRITKNNVYLGAQEAIDVYNALKAVTINGAIQYGEENLKGTIEEGKLANFTILDKDIENTNPGEIKNAKVIATWVNGECLYHK